MIICATWFTPYFWTTQSIILSRPRSSKSISISGSDTRSGFKKRSKSRSYLIGSTFVIPVQYATADPAADPRPGPTETPMSRACRVKSWTIRKYPGYPVFSMVASSNSIRSFISSVSSSYRILAPSKVRCLRYLFSPLFPLSASSAGSLNSSGISNLGRSTSWAKVKFSALSTSSLVFTMASGIAANWVFISSWSLKKYSWLGSPYRNPRPLPIGSLCFAPSFTQSKISWALASFFSP